MARQAGVGRARKVIAAIASAMPELPDADEVAWKFLLPLRMARNAVSLTSPGTSVQINVANEQGLSLSEYAGISVATRNPL